jgi:hypothetical protein
MARLKTRTLRYELRLTPVEKESWSVKAAAMGLDLSEYIRRCVERRQITTTIQPEVNRKTAVELGANWCEPQPTSKSDEHERSFWAVYPQC